MSLKQSTVPPIPGEGARPVEKGFGPAGVLLVVIGALLLSLAAGDALADSARGGGSTGALRGTEEGEGLVSSGGGDVIRGLDGDDELYGGKGRDVILGGAGDDFIETKDGAIDLVGCGSGADVASVDLSDRVALDCETLYPG